MDKRDNPLIDTYFASAERASREALLESRDIFLHAPVAMALLEAMPYPAMVLNDQRQIVTVNQQVLQLLGYKKSDELLGQRPGEAIECFHAGEGPGGCGTSQACAFCGAVEAILTSQQTNQPVMREGRLRTNSVAGGGALDLQIQASPVIINEQKFVVMTLINISSEKRRRILEHVFFHDVLNTAGGLRGLAELLLDESVDPQLQSEFKLGIYRLSERIVDEISAHRQLLAAEHGDLQVRVTAIALPNLLEGLVETFRHQETAQGRMLQLGLIPTISVKTDVVLLQRVLGNLIKNALEAVPPDSTVTVSAAESGAEVAITVNNPGVMSQEVQQQIFHRSFSTKGGAGRGIGTYSVRLFTEQYLGGRVSFVSRESEGTSFTVTLPKWL